jgi:hypothetical protein
MEARKLHVGEAESFQLSLRIRHPSMDPAEISQALKVEPEHSFRAGRPRAGADPARVHAESYWLGILDPAEWVRDLMSTDELSRILQKQLAMARGSLGAALSLYAARFLNAHAELLRRIRAEGGEITLLVTIHGPEVDHFTLAPEASQILGGLGVAVDFEIAGR